MWDIKKVPPQPELIALITGANSGIGYETAFELAKREVTIVMACRNMKAAEKAKARILASFPKAKIITKQIDLSSLNNFFSKL